jgi:hypothetical protein
MDCSCWNRLVLEGVLFFDDIRFGWSGGFWWIEVLFKLPEVLIQASRSYQSKHLLKKKIVPLKLWCCCMMCTVETLQSEKVEGFICFQTVFV